MIHYHGMPISGTQLDYPKFLKGRHALVSYANPATISIVAESTRSFVLDNGAFTFWKGGKTPNWDNYIDWVSIWSKHPGFDWWLIPDVIDGDEDANWRLIFEYGRQVPFGVPVYHMHESMYHLRRMATSFDRIAIGSSGKWSTPGTAAWWGRMGEIMETLCDSDGRPICKLHGLRMLSPKIFTKLPLSSADSSNAGRNSHTSKRFGIYEPPTSGQRADVIASRIEIHNSAPCWEHDLDIECVRFLEGWTI